MSNHGDVIRPSNNKEREPLDRILISDCVIVEWLTITLVTREEVSREIKAIAINILSGVDGKEEGETMKSAGVASTESNQNGARKAHRRIHSEYTPDAILYVEDALGIDKIKLFSLQCRRGEGATAMANQYPDVADARVLAPHLARGHLPVKFMDIKGSPDEEGMSFSRVFICDDMGDDRDAPIRLLASNGLGRVEGKGDILPLEKPDVEMTLWLSRSQARRLCHALKNYLQSWQTVQLWQKRS